MALNIFNQKDYQQIRTRIEQLDENNQRRWGTMNIRQMLEHCAIQLKLGLGILEQTGYEGSFIMRTGFGRWLSLYGMPWTRSLPTPSRMNMLKNQVAPGNVQAEKELLVGLLEQVQQSSSLKPHPFFGALNQKDWGRLIWKHLDYHLRQFGG